MSAQEKKEVREIWVQKGSFTDIFVSDAIGMKEFKNKPILFIEKSAYDELLKERDAAMAERDALKKELNAARTLDAMIGTNKEVCDLHDDVEALEAKLEQLEKDAQGLVEALENTRSKLIAEFSHRVYEVNFPEIDEALSKIREGK